MAVVVLILFGSASTLRASEVKPSTFFPLETRWVAKLDAPLAAAPAFDLQHAYVALRNGSLIAVRLADGKVAWSTDCETRFSPAPAEGIVVVATAQRLVGLRTHDGVPLWTTDLGTPVSAAPVWKTGWLLTVLENGEVAALRSEDGSEVWRRQLSGSLNIAPTVSGKAVFVPIADGRVVALDLMTSNPLWERAVGGSPREILASDDLFVGSTNNSFYRLSRDNGQQQWRWRTGSDIVGRPAADPKQVLFVSLDNVLRSLDRKSGVQQWRRPLPGRPTAGPTIIDDLVLVAGVTPEILAFNIETGAPAGTLKGPAEFVMPPHVLDPSSPEAPGVIATTGNGHLLAMLRPMGPPFFSLVFPPPPLLPAPELFVPAEVLPFEPRPNPSPNNFADRLDVPKIFETIEPAVPPGHVESERKTVPTGR